MPKLISNNILTTTRALAAFVVLFSFAQANAFQGRMQNVSIMQCGAKACSTVSAASADVSWFSTNLNLQNAKLSIKQTTGKQKIYNAKDIYFDNVGQRIYLHGVAELKNGEAFYDLRSEHLTVFSN